MSKKNTTQISKARQEIITLSKGMNTLLNTIVKTKNITKGTIYDQKKKCGHKNCKCFTGQLHQTRLISFNEQGKTRLIPLTKYSILELSKIERQVKEYQHFRKSRAKIVRYFKQLTTEINMLEKNLLIDVIPKKKGVSTYDRKKRKRQV